jgi:hypothetical protein
VVGGKALGFTVMKRPTLSTTISNKVITRQNEKAEGGLDVQDPEVESITPSHIPLLEVIMLPVHCKGRPRKTGEAPYWRAAAISVVL